MCTAVLMFLYSVQQPMLGCWTKLQQHQDSTAHDAQLLEPSVPPEPQWQPL